MNIKQTIISNLKNLPGTKTKRKLVVIYVDDYGSIRVRDKQAYNNLLKAGLAVDKTRYGYDTLCTTEDLQMLFDVLTSVKDKNGHHAVFTPFANIANPDFERIKNSGFQQYYREPFTETMKRLGSAYDGAYQLWKQGIASGIFRPEYHGTEHISVWKFMKALQEGHKSTVLSFENESVASPFFPDEPKIDNATAVFDIVKASDNDSLKTDIKVGLDMFEELLGYRAVQFTPGAAIYSPLLHDSLLQNGIKSIHVQRYKAYPLGDGKYEKSFLYTGKTNEVGQRYIVRNCVFEPFLDDRTHNLNAVNNCLLNIDAAFRMHTPAMVSTHRVNFAGAIESIHRDESLRMLNELLHEIVKRWPDVEFVSGGQLSELLWEN